MDDDYKKQIIEALIFASDVPISNNKIASIIEDDLTPGQVNKIVEELNSEYANQKRAYCIIEIAGGFQINTRKDLAPWIKKLFKGRLKTRLSQAGLESLAIITFKQPISRTEVDAIRGVNSIGVLKNLLERNLIAIAGRSKGPGKPLLYGTTREFLQYLGLNDIEALPKPREIAELMGKLEKGDGIAENIIEALSKIDNSEEVLQEIANNGNNNHSESMADDLENDET